jgi:hypothetical protein
MDPTFDFDFTVLSEALAAVWEGDANAAGFKSALFKAAESLKDLNGPVCLVICVFLSLPAPEPSRTASLIAS